MAVINQSNLNGLQKENLLYVMNVIQTLTNFWLKKLQEQLNTAEKALIEISSTRQEVWRGGTLVGLELTEDAKIAFEALAAIGGDDEQ
ncbi:MAG: hypothetical protein L0L07_05580 [Staphylococcus equorum]|nr:hypothetical protein [Staphylococcus equorum]